MDSNKKSDESGNIHLGITTKWLLSAGEAVTEANNLIEIEIKSASDELESNNKHVIGIIHFPISLSEKSEDGDIFYQGSANADIAWAANDKVISDEVGKVWDIEESCVKTVNNGVVTMSNQSDFAKIKDDSVVVDYFPGKVTSQLFTKDYPFKIIQVRNLMPDPVIGGVTICNILDNGKSGSTLLFDIRASGYPGPETRSTISFQIIY